MRRISKTTIWAPVALLVLSVGCGDDKKRSAAPEEEPNTPEECAPGADGCACLAGGQCDEGLACQADTCQTVTGLELVVSGDGVRGCEVVLDESGARVVGVDLSGVQGTWIRQAPKVAVTFVNEEDADVSRGSITVRVVAGTGSETDVGVGRSVCFGRDGARVAGASVSLEQG